MKLKFIFQPLLIAVVALILTACTADNTPIAAPAATLQPTITTARVQVEDSIKVDSAKATVSKSRKHKKVEFDPLVVNIFANLASETDGELYYSKSAKEVAKVIDRLLHKHAEENADVVFLIDNTGSMSDDILQIQLAVNDILDILQALPHVRVGVAGYGDKNTDGDNWFRAQPLSANFDHARKFIAEMPINGGGDYPESVYDGMMRVLDNFHWDNGKRMVLLIGDAPPLEDELSQFHLADVLQKAKEAHVEANVYPVVIGQEMAIDWPDSLAM